MGSSRIAFRLGAKIVRMVHLLVKEKVIDAKTGEDGRDRITTVIMAFLCN